MPRGKALFLAYDHGIEHGPKDFNLLNCNPRYVFDLAVDGKFDAIIVQAGLAEKYYEGYKDKIPLIIKLNGKTSLGNREPYSAANCSVRRALKLGASAVGYTIYPGSKREEDMFREAGMIIEEAHDHNLPVIMWSYPRGEGFDGKSTQNTAYAARVALELGADIVKVEYGGDVDGLKWVVKNAGKTRVMIAGGEKKNGDCVLEEARVAMDAGAYGLAVGRNIWQSDHPLQLANALRKIVFNNKSVEEVKKEFWH